jgi:hypothetical protein
VLLVCFHWLLTPLNHLPHHSAMFLFQWNYSDCLALTVFDAVDRYGYDVVLGKDSCATATIHGGKMMECLAAACCVAYSSDEIIVKHIEEKPQLVLVETPKAPLRGDVRFSIARQKR